jgi:hypothetical protein
MRMNISIVAYKVINIVTNNNVLCPTLRLSSLFAAEKKQRGRHLGDLGGLT